MNSSNRSRTHMWQGNIRMEQRVDLRQNNNKGVANAIPLIRATQ